MTVRTPRHTLAVRRDGKRVYLPAGVPVDLSEAEITHLERDSPDALMPARPVAAAAPEEPDTEEDEAAAAEAVRAAKAAGADKGKGKGKGAGKAADTEGL